MTQSGSEMPQIFGHPLPVFEPEHLPASAWIGHLPFGMWLVGSCRPRVLVELGVHNGASYCAFCETVVREGLGTACFGIDSWSGDPHAGFYGEEVLGQLRAHHDQRYGAFSRLVRASFDEALGHFADHSVDLLHIDGFHTYEAVRHDFESWRPKLSERSVVLFHDTNVREGSFGVWRFWEEVRRGRPHFEFLHSHGLGVLGVGLEQPEALQRLFAADVDQAAAIRTVFGQLGQRLVDLHDLRRKVAEQASALPEQATVQSRPQKQVEELVSDLSALREDLRKQKEALADAVHARHQCLADLDLLKTELEGSRRALAEREHLDAALYQRTAEVERLQRTLKGRDAEFSLLNRQLSELGDAAERNKRLLNAVRRSRSWRLTKPLRRIGLFGRQEKRLLRRPKKREHKPDRRTEDNRVSPAITQPPASPVVYRLSRLRDDAETALTEPIGKSRRLICVSHVSPFPPRAGNAYRIHRMLDWLRSIGWSVTLIVAPLPGDQVDERTLMTACPDLVVVYRDGRVLHSLSQPIDALEALDGHSSGDYAKVLRESAAADPLLEKERLFAHDPLIGVVKALVQGLAPQVLLVNYIFMTRMLPLIPAEVLKVVDTHDVFSTKQQKVVRYGIYEDLVPSGEDEGRLLARADLVIAIQQEEQRELQRIVRGRKVVVAGVDVDISETRRAAAGHVILLVASANPMNIRGLEDFLEFAWPKIIRDVPEAELWIAGAVGAEVDVDDPRIRRLGAVDDLADLYARSKVVINPAIAGTGLKIKTVEALGHLCPIVLWPSGIDGLGAEARALCDVVENWYDFAEAVLRLLRENKEDDVREVSEKRALLGRLLSAEHVYAELGKALDEKTSASPAAL